MSAAAPTTPGEAEGAGGTVGAPDGVVPLRRHRDFRRYWIAREVSIAGTLVTAVALPVLVYR